MLTIILTVACIQVGYSLQWRSQCDERHALASLGTADRLNTMLYRLVTMLTLSTAVISNAYTSNCSPSYWPNLPLLIFDIRALWHLVLNARVPECQKLEMVG